MRQFSCLGLPTTKSSPTNTPDPPFHAARLHVRYTVGQGGPSAEPFPQIKPVAAGMFSGLMVHSEKRDPSSKMVSEKEQEAPTLNSVCVCVCLSSMSHLSAIHTDWLSVLALYCTQLRENALIIQTEWEQLVQTHTQICTLCLSAPPAAHSVVSQRTN